MTGYSSIERDYERDRKKVKTVPMTVRLAVVSLVFLAGIAVGYALRAGALLSTEEPFQHFEVRGNGVQFTNPLLECSSKSDAAENTMLRPFSSKVEELRNRLMNSGVVRDVSIYFRDLNNGPWFSINPVICHSPSSILKIPLMIAILKEAETNPKILKKKITFNLIDGTDLNTLQHVKPLYSMVPGATYSVEDLVYRMIVFSDNNATALLQGSISPPILDRTYTELGIAHPYVRSSEYTMSVEACASFFRILFNASYLSREMSEKALGYLAGTDYRKGIVAGVPPTMAVAHKFGEREIGEALEIKELHDCGIVYYPNHPYLICVMTSGSSFQYLDDAVSGISRLIYQEVDGQHRQS